MITIRFHAAIGIAFSLALVSGIRESLAEVRRNVPSELEIEVAIAQLEDVETRLIGLETLIPLCGYGLPVQPALQGSEIGKRAAAAVKR